MSFPDRNNPYLFDAFLQWRRKVDYYCDDPFFQKVLKHYTAADWSAVDTVARRLSAKVSFRWRDMAESIAWPEKQPVVMHYDAYKHRIDRIVRPAEGVTMEKEVFAEALFSKKTSPWVRFTKMFLIYQNGEACISCPLTCTEGLVELLTQFADTPELNHIREHCQEGIEGDFAIGAQYLTEIQGGSDVPSNVVEAEVQNGIWRLYGSKFFCSATHADYAVVTAKPTGSEKIALFVVPSWLPGNKDREIRNGFTIDRIKRKMGTSELPTAEITFDGALAYPVGPLESGLANVVGIVLTYSRLTIGLASAASMTRAAREAQKYAEFRTAFGRKISQFPMVANQVARLEKYAHRTVAGAFKLYQAFLRHKDELSDKLERNADGAEQKERFDIRELIMLQKITATWDCTDVLRRAMSIFGGHGVMEDFSALPRLFRDAAINELWEGPRNVLLTQIHRDLQRAKQWYPPAEFVQHILSGGDASVIRTLAEEIEKLVAHPSLLEPDAETRKICERWDSFCHRFFHTYQDVAHAEVT